MLAKGSLKALLPSSLHYEISDYDIRRSWSGIAHYDEETVVVMRDMSSTASLLFRFRVVSTLSLCDRLFQQTTNEFFWLQEAETGW